MDNRTLLVNRFAFALSDFRIHLPKPGNRPLGCAPTADEFRTIAHLVITRLQGEGFTFERKPPPAGHSTPKAPI